MKTEINEVLGARGAVYGSYSEICDVTRVMRDKVEAAIHSNPKYDKLPNDVKHTIVESIGMILHKIARVAVGDPLHLDNFVDIAGYATLAVEEIEKQTEAPF